MTKEKVNSKNYIVNILRLLLLTIVTVIICYGTIYTVFGRMSGTFGNVLFFIATLIPIIICLKFFENKRLSAVGLTARKRDIAFFFGGITLAILMIATILMVLCVANKSNYFSLAVGVAIGSYSILIHYFIISFSEELLFRGYLFYNTFTEMKFWRRSLLMAVIFMLPHIISENGNQIFMGVTSFLIGLLFNYLVYITKSIWMGVGFHWIWNYLVLTVFYGLKIDSQAIMLVPIVILITYAIIYLIHRKFIIKLYSDN